MRKGEHKGPIKGQLYGRLVWKGSPPECREGGHYYYKMSCACGEEKMFYAANVLKGKSLSCGCWAKEVTSLLSTTHGKSHELIFDVWNMMVQRCHNPRYRLYSDYGGRGIKVCAKWRKFEGFYEDMGDRPFKGAMLERKDNDKNYTKSNCVWATRTEQNRNTRKTLYVEYKGKRYKFLDLAEALSFNKSKVYQRIHTYGWSVERAIDTP